VERALDWYRTTIVVPMADAIQERGSTFPETLSMTDFFLHEAPPMDGPSWDKAMGREGAAQRLDAVIAAYTALEEWTAPELSRVTEELALAAEMKLGPFQAPIRVAVTGRSVGPPLWESLVVLGREGTLERLRRAAARLAKG
jgi:glutamyl-tRNA synthetase